jgi:hypothetical protein
MTRLEAFIAGAPHYREDVAHLQTTIPILALLPAGWVETLWRWFSDDVYNAGYMTLDDVTRERFRDWLNQQVP